MAFYEQISRYYDYIFPVDAEPLDFIKETAGGPPKSLVDVACGSGGYSVELAKQGYEMTALDDDAAMVRLVQSKADHKKLPVKVMQCDMRYLEDGLKGKFDGVFCIGNSIVHLGSHKEIETALKQMNKLLQEGGKLILQIINYDRIIKYGVNGLPAIENRDAGLKFTREYLYDRERKIIKFNTLLTIDNGSQKDSYANSIELIPLEKADMERLLRNSGFERLKFYGDFKRSDHDDHSYLLVIEAEK